MQEPDPFEDSSPQIEERDGRLRTGGIVLLVGVAAVFTTAILWPTYETKRKATAAQLTTLAQEVTGSSLDVRPTATQQPLAELMGDTADTNDAWGNPIQYQLGCPSPATIRTYGQLFADPLTFTSFGEDGKAGGVERGEDIVVVARFLEGAPGCK
jgi:hypothetical protein